MMEQTITFLVWAGAAGLWLLLFACLFFIAGLIAGHTPRDWLRQWWGP